MFDELSPKQLEESHTSFFHMIHKSQGSSDASKKLYNMMSENGAFPKLNSMCDIVHNYIKKDSHKQ